MLRYAGLYWVFICKNLRSDLEMLLEFWINVAGRFLETALSFVFFWTALMHVQQIKGWSVWQLGLILATTSIVRSVAELCFTNVWVIPYKISSGELDRYLTKPINPLFNLISERIEVQGFGLLVSGILIEVWCLHRLHLYISFTEGLYYILMILCGGIIYLFLLLVFATVSFWYPGIDTYLLLVVVSLNEFSKFPITIFPRLIRFGITWIFPFALTGFFPTTFILRSNQYLWVDYCILPFTIVFSFFSYQFWKLGLRHYQSSGA